MGKGLLFFEARGTDQKPAEPILFWPLPALEPTQAGPQRRRSPAGGDAWGRMRSGQKDQV